MKHIIYCISLVIVAICAFILGQMQAKDKSAMIGFKADKIGIDSVDIDKSMRECVLETVNDNDYDKLESFKK